MINPSMLASAPLQPSGILTSSQSGPVIAPGLLNDEPSPSKPVSEPKCKKKGTAATVKSGLKRGGGIKKKSRSSKPKADTAAAILHPDNSESKLSPNSSISKAGSVSIKREGSEDQDAGDGSDEEDPGPYCICRGPDDHRFMIACDGCQDWFHGECVGLDKTVGETLVKRYICPGCTAKKPGLSTRYKLECAWLPCGLPARLYSEAEGVPKSNFCCDEHRDLWWEQVVLSLPKETSRAAGALKNDILTQDRFLALLSKGLVFRKPFAIPSDFWQTVPTNQVLTPEEQDVIKCLVAKRESITQKIPFYRQMGQLHDMGVQRWKSAKVHKHLHKDACGYDTRLDFVGDSITSFARWRDTDPEGVAAFREGRLDVPLDLKEEEDVDEWTAGMCLKRACKKHLEWNVLHAKTVRSTLARLQGDTRETEQREAAIKQAAALRYMRKTAEKNIVAFIKDDDEKEDEDEVMGEAPPVGEETQMRDVLQITEMPPVAEYRAVKEEVLEEPPRFGGNGVPSGLAIGAVHANRTETNGCSDEELVPNSR